MISTNCDRSTHNFYSDIIYEQIGKTYNTASLNLKKFKQKIKKNHDKKQVKSLKITKINKKKKLKQKRTKI